MDLNDPRSLIECLQNPDCPKREAAWSAFVHRYQKQMKAAIARTVYGRAKHSFNDKVEDIFSQVLLNLQTGIRSFDVEKRINYFEAWLWTVCANSAKKYFRNPHERITDVANPVEIGRQVKIRDNFFDAEWFELAAHRVREKKKGRKSNSERDLHIFHLRRLEGLDPDQIWHHPCVHGDEKPGPGDSEQEQKKRRHFIEVIISRVKDLLEEGDTNTI